MQHPIYKTELSLAISTNRSYSGLKRVMVLGCRRDNMTAVVVAFPAATYGEGEGVAARVRERQAREEREAAVGGGDSP